jgi:arsenite/tail-anchored protein-transporting ATPase
VRHLLSRRVLFFGGKGGVGKTTCAAAYALAASRGGRRVLLVSADPAHSTSDVFETPLGVVAREIAPRLFAMELDADAELRRYLDEAKLRMANLFAPHVIREAARQIELTATMPGVADVALFDRMSELVAGDAGGFDLVVFDTAPTGHSLRLLRLPELMGTWVTALAARRRDAAAAAGDADGRGSAPDPVATLLEARSARLRAVREALTAADRVAFVLVLIPERLPIEESARAVHQLQDAGISLGGLIVNRVLPDEADGAYVRARRAQERVHLAEVDRRLPAVPRAVVPQFEADVHGLAALDRVAAYLLG